MWAHQLIHPLQDGWYRWNRLLTDWWHQKRAVNFFVRTIKNNRQQSGGVIIKKENAFAGDLIDNLFENDSIRNKKKITDSEQNRLKDLLHQREQQVLQLTLQVDSLQKSLHVSRTYTQQLLHEISELKQLKENNTAREQVPLLQQQLNIITNKWMLATETISRLTTDLQHLESVEKELIDTANYVKDLEQQLQKTAILESDIKSMEAEREWLLLQLQEIKTHQHHDYAHLQSNYTTLLEERNLLQDKIVLLESEVGALSRVLNNNKQKQNEDAWWETKYLIAARELEAMRRQYAAMENELSIAKNKEQVLREKAKQAEGLKATLHLRQQELEALQRELYLCSKK